MNNLPKLTYHAASFSLSSLYLMWHAREVGQVRVSLSHKDIKMARFWANEARKDWEKFTEQVTQEQGYPNAIIIPKI